MGSGNLFRAGLNCCFVNAALFQITFFPFAHVSHRVLRALRRAPPPMFPAPRVVLSAASRLHVLGLARGLAIPPLPPPAAAPLKSIARRAKIMRGEGTIETVTRVLALQREGRDIVRMEVGDPDFDTPTHITDAAVEVR